MKLNNILGAKGIHYLIRSYGPAWLRSRSFDAKYRRGDWNFTSKSHLELSKVLQPWLKGGDLLILGCGEASIVECLKQGTLTSVLGVDLSDEALHFAKRYETKTISFQKADMLRFVPSKKYDVILFSESLYYVSVENSYRMLQNLANYLKADGNIVTTFAQPKRYSSYIEMIRKSFCVHVDKTFNGSSRHLLVFSIPGRDRNP